MCKVGRLNPARELLDWFRDESHSDYVFLCEGATNFISHLLLGDGQSIEKCMQEDNLEWETISGISPKGVLSC